MLENELKYIKTKLKMRKMINEHVTKAKALLVTRPNDKLVKSYLLRLKSLKNVADVRLIGLYESIPLILEAVENQEGSSRSRAMIDVFSVMIKNAKIAFEADKLQGKFVDVDDNFLNSNPD